MWFALTRVLQNAFIQALQPSIDQEINIATVDSQPEEKKTFLEKVFGKKDDKDKDKDKGKDDDKDKKKS